MHRIQSIANRRGLEDPLLTSCRAHDRLFPVLYDCSVFPYVLSCNPWYSLITHYYKWSQWLSLLILLVGIFVYWKRRKKKLDVVGRQLFGVWERWWWWWEWWLEELCYGGDITKMNCFLGRILVVCWTITKGYNIHPYKHSIIILWIDRQIHQIRHWFTTDWTFITLQSQRIRAISTTTNMPTRHHTRISWIRHTHHTLLPFLTTAGEVFQSVHFMKIKPSVLKDGFLGD